MQPADKPQRIQRIVMLAVMATVVLLAGFTLLVLKQGGHSTEAFRAEMAMMAAGGITLDHSSDDPSAAKSWLEQRGYPAYPDVPERLTRLRCQGCKTIDWGAEKIGLVSFLNDRDQVIYLFIIGRNSLNDLESINSPLEKTAVLSQLETAGWRGDRHAYLLVGSTPEVKL